MLDIVLVYLWQRRRRVQAEGRCRLDPDGRAVVLWAGGDGAVGGGAGSGLPLEELQDGLDVCSHLGLQSDHTYDTHTEMIFCEEIHQSGFHQLT